MQPQQVQIKAADEEVKGRYANNMTPAFSREEMFLDFTLMNPIANQLVGRIIVSPAHAKKIAKLLSDTIQIYKKEHGEIKELGQQQGQIGFRTPAK